MDYSKDFGVHKIKAKARNVLIEVGNVEAKSDRRSYEV